MASSTDGSELDAISTLEAGRNGNSGGFHSHSSVLSCLWQTLHSWLHHSSVTDCVCDERLYSQLCLMLRHPDDQTVVVVCVCAAVGDAMTGTVSGAIVGCAKIEDKNQP